MENSQFDASRPRELCFVVAQTVELPASPLILLHRSQGRQWQSICEDVASSLHRGPHSPDGTMNDEGKGLALFLPRQPNGASIRLPVDFSNLCILLLLPLSINRLYPLPPTHCTSRLLRLRTSWCCRYRSRSSSSQLSISSPTKCSTRLQALQVVGLRFAAQEVSGR
jgi:hypothetical protein